MGGPVLVVATTYFPATILVIWGSTRSSCYMAWVHELAKVSETPSWFNGLVYTYLSVFDSP